MEALFHSIVNTQFLLLYYFYYYMQIMFTNHKTLGDTTEIEKKLESLDDDLAKIVREGKQLEVEMLFLITQSRFILQFFFFSLFSLIAN